MFFKHSSKNSLIIVFFSPMLLFLSGCGSVDSSGVHHPHPIWEVLLGYEENGFICYPSIHRNYYIVVFLSSIFSAIILFKRFQLKKKTALQLSFKNKIIEEKSKEITDSIHYALRIQKAILPSPDQINACFNNYFVLYKPKAIVSGDFYWVSNISKDNKSVIAAIDCTGHGVPGAFLSIIAYNALNKIINEQGETEPSAILDRLNSEVKETLNKDQYNQVKDGMDISLCVFDRTTNTLSYCGANSPLYFLSEGNLKKLKGTKRPIGYINDESHFIPFTSHSIKVQTGDQFYLFSDGFADQFGGANNKKLMSETFKKSLLKNASLSLSDQKDALENLFEKWKGDHEQVDDVLIIGIKV